MPCFIFFRHKADADQIEKIAKDANDTSTKAYNLLMKTLDGENKINKDIEDLNQKYVSLYSEIKVRLSVHAALFTKCNTSAGTTRPRIWRRTWRNRPIRYKLKQSKQETRL